MGEPAKGEQALSEREVAIIDFERSWWKFAGAKEHAVRERFGISATRYYELLNELLAKPAAVAHDPVLIKRLRRLRSYREKQRVARLLGADYSSNRG